MLELYRRVIGSNTLHVVVTERVDGDQRPDRDASPSARDARIGRQRLLTGRTWSMAAEEHGIAVVDADVKEADDSPPPSLPPGDVLVTTRVDRALAIWAGDCAPLVLCGQRGTLVAAHAGWRGLAAGVIAVAVGEVTGRGDKVAAAVLGPCIHPECYEFGDHELEAVAAGVGVPIDRIVGSTLSGRRALDVPGAVTAALGKQGICLDVVGPCSSCDERWFSYRARAEDVRHAVVAWTAVA